MSFSDRRAVRHMKTPVNGIFKVTGFQHVKSATHITGVITAPGIPDTPAEHKTDREGRWAESTELPVVVDEADPSKFIILWDQVDSDSWSSPAQQLSIRISAGQDGASGAGAPFQFPGQPGAGFGGGAGFVSTVTIGPDGQPTQLSAENAARVAEVLQQKLGLSVTFNGPGGGFSAPNGGFPAPNGGFPPPNGGFSAPSGGFPVTSEAPMTGFPPGEHGTAVVLDARDVPVQPGYSAPAGEQTELLLEVSRADGSLYQTRTVIAFSSPEHRAAIAVPGRRLQVRIDPNAPDRVTIVPPGRF